MQVKIKNDYPLVNNVRYLHLLKHKEQRVKGVYKHTEKVELVLEISRRLGVCHVKMCLLDDATSKEQTITFDYIKTEHATDTYKCALDLEKLCCGRKEGLFYYYIELVAGRDTYYLSCINNSDYEVHQDSNCVRKFRLLVHDAEYKTPEWAKNAVMYHIFVDRFCASNEKKAIKDRCEINQDWYNGIPKYAENVGDDLDNNEFFGGDLYGVVQKLDYLESLGVNCVYLSPIFDAYSNHKYDTGNYMCVDEMFGGEKAFDLLVSEAQKRNMHIILDGVFNHTGDDSLYFNKYARYSSVGAYQSVQSPYYSWYIFTDFPCEYKCWWDIKILPKLNLENPSVKEFFLGENGVIRHYLRRGISGWRLDVADELSNDFLSLLRKSVKTENENALIIGEVWENAADKISYDKRKKYLSGYQLDSVMNYPFKNAIVKYLKTGNSIDFYNSITEITSSYPEETLGVLMNVLGTHDTERILTLLGCNEGDLCLSNSRKADFKLELWQRQKALKLLEIATVLQFTLPGMPCIFYADEAGVEGMGDPFCRKPYPWGREEKELIEHYRRLGSLKRNCKALEYTNVDFLENRNGVCMYRRGKGKDTVIVCVNMGSEPYEVNLPHDKRAIFAEPLISCGKTFVNTNSAVIFG